MQEGTACGNNATYRKEQNATLPVAPTHQHVSRKSAHGVAIPPDGVPSHPNCLVYKKEKRELIKNERSTVALLLRPMLVGYYRMDDGQRHAPDAIFL